MIVMMYSTYMKLFACDKLTCLLHSPPFSVVLIYVVSLAQSRKKAVCIGRAPSLPEVIAVS